MALATIRPGDTPSNGRKAFTIRHYEEGSSLKGTPFHLFDEKKMAPFLLVTNSSPPSGGAQKKVGDTKSPMSPSPAL